MAFYISLLFLSTGIVFIGDYYDSRILSNENVLKTNYTKYALIFSCFCLVLVGSLRSLETGADVLQYSKYFYNGYHTGKMEWGYVFLSNLIYYLTKNYRVFLVVLQVLTIAPIFYVIFKASKKPYLSVFLYQSLYLYAGTFNILRQALAMSFVLIAYYILIKEQSTPSKKNIYLSSIFIVIASFFHIVSLVFILIPLLSLIEFTPKRLAIVCILSGLFLLLRNTVITLVFELLGRGYYDGFRISVGWTSILIIGSVSLLIIINQRDRTSNYSVFRLDSNIVYSALILNILWVWFPNHARITQFFFLIMIIIIPNQLTLNRHKFNRRLLTMIVFFIAFYVFQLVYRDYAQVVPYSLFF